MSEPAGPVWCARFPTSTSLADLAQPFQANATAFILALRAAGASVEISATYRPPERAYLMHWACLIAGFRDVEKIFHQISAADVPAMPEVEIDWTCGGDFGAARSAAVSMVKVYGIAFPAALVSRHTQRRAIDMTVRWQGSIAVLSKNGNSMQAASQSDLVPIGGTYGVMKLATDPPHWSDDGH